MNQLLYIVLPVIAGASIAAQSAMSGQLNTFIKNSFFVSFVIYFSSMVVVGSIIFIQGFELPSIDLIKSVPRHLWFLGAILSVFALTLLYWLMPQVGVSRVMVGVLIGQLFMSLLSSHYGWFGLPIVEINLIKTFGILLIIVGVMRINKEY